jgi:ribosomal protein S24E
MEIKDIKETKNLVFERREIECIITADSIPSNKEVIQALAKKLSASEDSIKIKGIYGKFGINEFQVKANVYKSKEEKNKIERKTKKEIETEKKEIEAAKKAAEDAKKEAEEKKKAEEAAKEAEKKAQEEKANEEKTE